MKNYAVIQLVVEEAMFNAGSYIHTFENFDKAKEAFKNIVAEEKELIKETNVPYEDNLIENGEQLEYVLKSDVYGTKVQLINLENNFTAVTF